MTREVIRLSFLEYTETLCDYGGGGFKDFIC